MNIFIDADACPTAVKDIIVRAAVRKGLPAFFVANQPVKLPKSDNISMIIVDAGPDEADKRIVEMVHAGDLVVSEDIPLADSVIEKGAYVITTRGELLTKENIKERLSVRDLMNDLRDSGIETGGPSGFKQKDIRNFANQFDRFLTRNCVN